MTQRFAIATCVFIAFCVAATGTADAAPMAWVPPIRLTSEREMGSFPHLAVDAAGDAVAAWQGYADVEASSRSAHGGWSPPVTLSPLGREAGAAAVGFDSAGDATAVWESSGGPGDQAVESATKPAGGAWSAPVDVYTGGHGVYDTHIAVDAAGDAVAVWLCFEGDDGFFESSSRPAGGNWTAPVQISPAGQDSTGARVAIDSAGEAVAIWSGSNGANSTIESASRPAGGDWTSPVGLSTTGGREPEVAVDAGGDAVAVWAIDETASLIKSATRPASGDWSAASVISGAEHPASEPQLAVDPVGDAVALWSLASTPRDYRVQAVSRPEGGSWGSARQIPFHYFAEEPPEAKVAMRPDGTTVALWQRTRQSDYSIAESAEMPIGEGWGETVELSSREFVREPQLGIDSAGAVALWRGEGAQIQAAVQGEAHQLLVTVDGSGTVDSAPDWISCGFECEAGLAEGTQVTLSGSPSFGSEAVVWESCPGVVNGSNECELTMGAGDEEVIATFDRSLAVPPVVPDAPASSTPAVSVTPAADPPPVAAVPHCVVPKLIGARLKAARKKLAAANCKLGRVAKAGGATAKTGKIEAQSPAAGKSAGVGPMVNVTLKP